VQPAVTYMPMGAIPHRVQVATIAIEDERFFQHHGVDSQGVMRALWNNLRSGRMNEGASTITQQLAKRIYLQGDDRSWRRKADDIILAVKIEGQYGKAQILEWYLNDIYYGRGATGIGPAARRYFGVAPIELTLAQAALLAGLPQAPSALDPYTNFAGAKARQRAVLTQMAHDGYISTQQADTAAAEPLRLR
jgi:penicillin-binding protein 1A